MTGRRNSQFFPLLAMRTTRTIVPMKLVSRVSAALGGACCLALATLNGLTSNAAHADEATSATGSTAETSSSLPAVHLDWVRVVKRPPLGSGRHSSSEDSGSRQVNGFAIPILVQSTMQSQGEPEVMLTGATYTAKAFRTSLQAAILKLAQHTTSTTVYGSTLSVRNPKLAYRYGVLQVEVRGEAR